MNTCVHMSMLFAVCFALFVVSSMRYCSLCFDVCFLVLCVRICSGVCRMYVKYLCDEVVL